MRPLRVLTRAAVITALAGAFAARAQQPNPSAASVGMGEAYSAVARGYAAAAWNPAGLALPGAPRSSLALFPAGTVSGLGPVTLGDLADYEDRFVPATVREGWLADIVSAGGQRGSAGVDLTYVAFSVGRVGVQAGTRVRTRGRLSPDAAELLFFGNVGLGEPRDFDLSGSTLDADAVSTLAVAYGHPVDLGARGRLALGVTLKYAVGHAMVAARDRGSRVTADPLEIDLRFPVVHSDTTPRFDNGHGFGADLGVSWAREPWVVSAVVENALNTFEWAEDAMFFRPGEAFLAAGESETRVDPEPLSAAPDDVRGWRDDHGFGPVLRVGAARRVSARLLVAADARTSLGDRVAYRSESHLAVGAELLARAWLPLRAGFGFSSDGLQLSAGAGVALGIFRLDGGVQRREHDGGSQTVGLVTLSAVRTPRAP